MEVIQEFDLYWFWFAVALGLLALEGVFGSFRFLGASIAAVVVGILSQLFPYVGFLIELLFFGVLAATCVWLAGSYLKEQRSKAEHLKQVYRDKAYLGNEYVLSTPMSNGQGNISIDGVSWQLRGPACDTGQTVRVVAMNNGMLQVELVEVEPASA